MARKDEDGVYWMNVHDAAKQLMRSGIPWDTNEVLNKIDAGVIHAAKEQRIAGRPRWRISSTEIKRLVKREQELLVEHAFEADN